MRRGGVTGTNSRIAAAFDEVGVLARSHLVSARRLAQLLALFGLYAILGVRIIGLSQSSTPSTTMLAELAGLSVLFLIAAIYILTRPARRPVE